MKINRAIIAAIITIVVILAIIGSLALNIGSTAEPTAAPSVTSRPDNTPLPTFTPDPCAPQNVQAVALDYHRLSRQFDDLSVIAQNTPREQLVPIIAELQSIRRSSEDYPMPPCLIQLKEYQISYMNVFIDTLVALYSSLTSNLTQADIELINQGMTQAIANHDLYLIELARLLGVTPSVPATLEVTATP